MQLQHWHHRSQAASVLAGFGYASAPLSTDFFLSQDDGVIIRMIGPHHPDGHWMGQKWGQIVEHT